MDVLTYSWLTSNTILNNEQSSYNNCNNLLDSLLILSSNNILISINNLIQYCTTTTAGATTHLNNKQFQILNDSINSYINSINSPDTTTTTTDNHDDSTLTTNHNNNIINSNNTKFDCSIILIIENNKKLLNYNNNNNNTTAATVVDNKKRKIYNQDDYSIIKTKNKNKIRNNDNDSLFYRIWRNIVIRNEILLHVRLYNIHSLPIKVSKDVLKELPNYKLYGYIKSIHIDSNFKFGINSLPYGLEYISFSKEFNQLIFKDMIPDTVKTIEFDNRSKFNQTLNGNWLPPSLTSLKFGNSFDKSIKLGHLPNSLTNFEICDDYRGNIEHGALPKSLMVKDKCREFGYYKFDSNYGENYIGDSIPKSTTKLYIDGFNQSITQGNIPHNVTSLKIVEFYDDLQPFVFPPSITDLTICHYSFFQSIENILPPNLTSLSISSYELQPTESILPKSITTLKLYSIQYEIDAVLLLPNLTTLQIEELELPFPQASTLFPKSLTSIKIHSSVKIPKGFFINHTNLKTLAFEVSQLPISAIPSPSITDLELNFQSNNNVTFPLHNFTSLTNLKLNGYNRTIGIGKLPSTLTSLTLGEVFNKPINNGVLPNNLKELYILNKSYNKYIPTSNNDDNQLPTSLQSIIIPQENHKFLNNLNLNFISTYIKFNKSGVNDEED